MKRKPYKCKFCRSDVWWDIIRQTTMQTEAGDEKHLPYCPRKSAHFKAEALTRGQQKRNERFG